MKVAYNSCYGGFGLSALAETEYRAKKGITLTWYKSVGSAFDGPYERVALESVDDSLTYCASTTDLGESVKKIPEGAFFYESWHGEENRSDPDLIEVIERLGEKANGMCADLAIKEIPDGAAFEIDEYDGNESVVPPRSSW